MSKLDVAASATGWSEPVCGEGPAPAEVQRLSRRTVTSTGCGAYFLGVASVPSREMKTAFLTHRQPNGGSLTSGGKAGIDFGSLM
jgi:hypothetical protein